MAAHHVWTTARSDGSQTLSAPTAVPLKRKRPVRTYGRRSAPAPVKKPGPASNVFPSSPATRRRKEDRSSQAEETARADLTPPEKKKPALSKLSPQDQQAKRGTILSFFKPAPAPPVSAPPKFPTRPTSSEATTAATATASSGVTTPTPPGKHRAAGGSNPSPSASPPTPVWNPKPRKRRKLTTRPVFDPDDNSSVSGAGGVQMQHGKRGSPAAANDENMPPRDWGCRDASSAASAEPPTCSIARRATPATMPELSSACGGAEGQQEKNPSQPATALGMWGRRGNGKKKDLVQTTLSLGIINSEDNANFKICEECDILYNPLNEKDRLEHKRRHAAHVRARRKALGAAALETTGG